jgi:hypothetical protein
MAPLFGLEDGARAGFGLIVGLGAAVLLPIGFWKPRANVATAGLGIVMGFANFFMPGTVFGYASFATCSVMLIMAGMAPWPVVTGTVRAGMAAAAPEAARDGRETGDMHVPIAA